MIATDLQEARKQLAEILADPEFGRKKASPGEEPGFSLAFLKEWLSEIPMEVVWGAYIFTGVIILIILIWFIRIWWISRPVKKRLLKKQQDKKERQWLEEASQLAEQGNYRQAIRPLYQYVLEFSSQKRKLRLQIDKTNGDYRQEMKQTWPLHLQSFNQVTDQFDQIWYGEKEIAQPEYLSYQEKVKEFVEKGEQDETK